MRIIAGTYASRKINAPKGKQTRPTLDKVREAVFSSAGGFFAGGVFLDLYAGSGANGLEALSRGCEKAVFVDSSKAAVSVIRENIRSLDAGDRCQVLPVSDRKALQILKEESARFDYIYMDPPYEKQHNEEILSFIDANGMLKEGGLIMVESLKENNFPDHYKSFYKKKEAVYGVSKITYYKFKE